MESESAFNSEKIGSEHRQIRQRERLEEQRTAKIEAKRVWLIKSIQKCSRTQNMLQVSTISVEIEKKTPKRRLGYLSIIAIKDNSDRYLILN